MPVRPIPVGRRWPVDRQMFVVAHRWVGLVLAGFLLLAGVTGALLVWNDALDEAISPALFRVTPPSAEAVPMDPVDLVERVQARYPQAQVRYAPLRVEAGRTLVVYLAANTEAAQQNAVDLPNDQIFVDPYRGVVVGERKWGDIGQGWKNLMPFIYRLHFSLALDTIGSYVFGVIALLWTLDCFVGAYLTFPAALKKKRADSKPWRRRWWPSWKVRWDGGAYKVTFDLHRAGGLWVWAMLFVLAWSSVAFDLSEVYDPVMKTVLAHQPEGVTPQGASAAQAAPLMNWRHAHEMGRRLMAEQASLQVPPVVVINEEALGYDASARTYRYVVRSDRDIRDHRGATSLTFDAGGLAHLWLPTGAAAGDTVRTWLTSLHMAAVWGLPFDVFVTVMGLLVAMLSVTGVVIWWKKWRGRRAQAARLVGVAPLAAAKATRAATRGQVA
ncbi:PepSY-associated TM helix domain-containing protein [Pigmentiphaga litoralis]|uniref:Putative iron-regulated membrane protein n=1 Tax=Pigmentiphaga litoralis TaxID=516702 RepID=A0A7Y9LNV4_9BURK|nr:PepSY-associated TM helix domain-containing protein [Pigmentiphaga litoralis]NYE25992.1 putative iron-regulated membrane protein [Pigmentiphaga litoralis]NYE85112.1 putative iron-regulated membrane protein [Pigmentiphaga litoralis]